MEFDQVLSDAPPDFNRSVVVPDHDAVRSQYLHDSFRVLSYMVVKVATVNEGEVDRRAQEMFPLDCRRILQNLSYLRIISKDSRHSSTPLHHMGIAVEGRLLGELRRQVDCEYPATVRRVATEM